MHRYGCGRWFNVARDTVTHEIHAVYEMGEAKPDLAETKIRASSHKNRLASGGRI